MAHWMHWPPGRAVVGGAATLGLMVARRSRLPRSLHALCSDSVRRAATSTGGMPLLKLVFTVIALGTGFVGGEVLPLFVMGGTLGAAIAPGLHATGTAAGHHRLGRRRSPSAACVALTGVVLTVEQFGWHTLDPGAHRRRGRADAAGRPGLYVAHH